MPITTDILHPGPIRHVPKGARKPRIEHEAMRTPVMLREVSRSDLAPAGQATEWRHDQARVHAPWQETHAFHRLDGALWIELTGSSSSRPDAPTGREAVLGFLSGEHGHDAWGGTDLSRHFTRSPVLAAVAGARTRGSEIDMARSRGTVDDAREEARVAVQRLARDGLLLCEGSLLARTDGPVAAFVGGRINGLRLIKPQVFPGAWLEGAVFKGCEYDRVESTQTYPVRPDDLGTFLHSLGHNPGVWGCPRPEVERAKLDSTGLPFGDADIALMANSLPAKALRRAMELRHGEVRPPSEALVQAMARLMPLEMRGGVGLIESADAEATFRAVLELREAIEAGRLLQDKVMSDMKGWIEGVALRRLGTDPRMAVEDEDSLSTMAP